MVRRRVPVSELVDLEHLRAGGRPLTPRRVREALPRGWVLEEDGEHAHRDARLFFREAWILLLGLVVFGCAALVFLWGGLPRGWAGVVRLVLLVALTLLVGGFVGPWVTRTLGRRG